MWLVIVVDGRNKPIFLRTTSAGLGSRLFGQSRQTSVPLRSVLVSAIEGLTVFGCKLSYREWASYTERNIALTRASVYKATHGALKPYSLSAANIVTRPLSVFNERTTDSAGQIRRLNMRDIVSGSLHLNTVGSANMSVQACEGESEGPGNVRTAW